MSVQAIAKALEVQGVSSSEKFLLVVLANYANPKMSCWPSLATLAADMSVDRSTVKRLMRSLETRGLIERTARKRGNSSLTSSLIKLCFDRVMVTLGVGSNNAIDGVMVTPPEPKEPLDLKRARPTLQVVSAREFKRADIPGEPLPRGEARKLFGDLTRQLANAKKPPITRRAK